MKIEKMLEKYPEMLRVSEAADVLGVSQQTVRRYIKNGEFEVIRVGDRGVKIPKESLIEYLEAHIG